METTIHSETTTSDGYTKRIWASNGYFYAELVTPHGRELEGKLYTASLSAVEDELEAMHQERRR